MRRNGPSALALPATVVVAAVWLAIACASGGAGSSVASAAPSNAPQTVRASAAPATTTAAAATVAAPTATPHSEATAIDEVPPVGLLSEGSAPVGGQLGPYCWQGACADGAMFQIGSLPVFDAVAALTFSLQDDMAFGSVDAAYEDASGTSVPLGSAGKSFDPDAQQTAGNGEASFTFPAPPTGQWVVTAHVRFLQGGDAVYGWQVNVP
jgi:hypothetical protein